MEKKSGFSRAVGLLFLALILGFLGGIAGSYLSPGAKQIITAPNGKVAPGAGLAAPGGKVSGESSNAFADVAAQAIPSVVNISVVNALPQTTRQKMRGQTVPRLPDLLEREFPFLPIPVPKEQRGVGSGVIVRSDGLILTNEHVVKDANQIKVTLSDGRKFSGKVIGRDRELDLAVIQVKAANLPAARLGDSSQLRPGDWALTVGSPLGFSSSVTLGVVSALGRSISVEDRNYGDLIQTDASIIPGNSGGPLLNAAGEVVGINTAIQLTMDERSLGAIAARIGFAVPINDVKENLPDLISKGKIVRPWVGIYMKEIQEEDVKRWQLPQEEGIIVEEVRPNTPAAKAGIFKGDIIQKIDGKKPKDSREVQALVRRHKPGEVVVFEVLREAANGDWKPRIVKIKTAIMPEVVPPLERPKE